MKIKTFGATLAALFAMGEVALSLPVENAQVRQPDGSNEGLDSPDASKAYYFRQNGRVTFDHGLVHYVDAPVARAENDVDQADGTWYWPQKGKRVENDVDEVDRDGYWAKKKRRVDNDIDEVDRDGYWARKEKSK